MRPKFVRAAVLVLVPYLFSIIITAAFVNAQAVIFLAVGWVLGIVTMGYLKAARLI